MSNHDGLTETERKVLTAMDHRASCRPILEEIGLTARELLLTDTEIMAWAKLSTKIYDEGGLAGSRGGNVIAGVLAEAALQIAKRG